MSRKLLFIVLGLFCIAIDVLWAFYGKQDNSVVNAFFSLFMLFGIILLINSPGGTLFALRDVEELGSMRNRVIVQIMLYVVFALIGVTACWYFGYF